MINNENKQIIFHWLQSPSAPQCIKGNTSQITLANISRKLLEFYQGQCSQLFNKHLRKHKANVIDNSILDDCIKLVFAELITYPQYSDKTVYRSENITVSFAEISNWFLSNKKEIISFPGFLSCSINDWGKKNTDIKFVIKTIKFSRGFDICSLNMHHPEKEVIFLPNTCFKIIKIDEYQKIIHLIETSDSPTIILYENEGFYNISEDSSNGESSLSDLAEDF